jgi:hypothetical protein
MKKLLLMIAGFMIAIAPVKADVLTFGVGTFFGVGLEKFANSKYNFPLRECDKKPFLKAQYAKGGNDLFVRVSQCDYNENPSKYKIAK